MLVTPFLQRQVASDAEQKRPQLAAAAIEPARIAQQQQEYVLRDILGCGVRVGHTPGEAVDRIFVLIEGGPKFPFGHRLFRTLNHSYRKRARKIRDQDIFFQDRNTKGSMRYSYRNRVTWRVN